MCQTADAKRQWKKRNRYKMPRENYRRIMKGYEPHEPTNTFSFYKRKPVLKENLISALLKETTVLSFLSTGSFFRKKVLGMRIRWKISGKIKMISWGVKQ